MSRCWVIWGLVAIALPACSKSTVPPSIADADQAATHPSEIKAEPPAYLSAAEAGPDFDIQGEYVGLSGDVGSGTQLIARGDGKFHCVLYDGGLPGAGWTKGNLREEFNAARTDAGVVEIDRKDPLSTTIVADGKITSTRSAPNSPKDEMSKIERKSPTLGAQPPAGAIVLFDGSSADAFEDGRIDDQGLLMEGATSKQKFGDCTVHVEFRTPFMPTVQGQQRGNSGVYLQGRYEVQILDSFGLEPADNLCGGIYEIAVPKLNMCFPPLSWQTYDIDYTTAKFDESGKKIENARITVRHNGELIHDNVELTHATRSAPVAEGPEKGPLYLQDHHNPVRFRNVWVVEK